MEVASAEDTMMAESRPADAGLDPAASAAQVVCWDEKEEEEEEEAAVAGDGGARHQCSALRMAFRVSACVNCMCSTS